MRDSCQVAGRSPCSRQHLGVDRTHALFKRIVKHRPRAPHSQESSLSAESEVITDVSASAIFGPAVCSTSGARVTMQVSSVVRCATRRSLGPHRRDASCASVSATHDGDRRNLLGVSCAPRRMAPCAVRWMRRWHRSPSGACRGQNATVTKGERPTATRRRLMPVGDVPALRRILPAPRSRIPDTGAADHAHRRILRLRCPQLRSHATLRAGGRHPNKVREDVFAGCRRYAAQYRRNASCTRFYHLTAQDQVGCGSCQTGSRRVSQDFALVCSQMYPCAL